MVFQLTGFVNKPDCVNLVQKKNNNSLREYRDWAIFCLSAIAPRPLRGNGPETPLKNHLFCRKTTRFANAGTKNALSKPLPVGGYLKI
jgi:hypothetical protein